MNSVCFCVMFVMEFTSICLHLLKLDYLDRDWCENRLGRNHFHKHRLAACRLPPGDTSVGWILWLLVTSRFGVLCWTFLNVCKEGKTE